MKEKETVTDLVKHQILSTNITLKKKKKKSWQTVKNHLGAEVISGSVRKLLV